MAQRRCELVCDQLQLQVSRTDLITQCLKFRDNPALLEGPYKVVSNVCPDSLRAFINALSGSTVDITNQNAFDLHRLCREFGFMQLQTKVLDFLAGERTQDLECPWQDQPGCQEPQPGKAQELLKDLIAFAMRVHQWQAELHDVQQTIQKLTGQLAAHNNSCSLY
jgi:hypothetical protein